MRAVKRKRGQGESHLKDETVQKTNLLRPEPFRRGVGDGGGDAFVSMLFV